MTTTVDANNTAGFKVTADTSGVLQLQTNSTAALTVDTGQNVGVGTTSPGAKLEIKGGASDNATFNINNSSGNIWKLWNDNGASGLNIQYNGSTKVVIDNGGNVLVGTSSLSTPPTGYMSVANTFGFKNRLINGGLQVWQRGTSVAGVNAYTSADRWYMSGSGTMTSARSATLDSPNGNYSLVLTSGATSSYINPSQAIEAANVYSLRGKTVTFSFYCKLTAGTWGGGALLPQLFYSNSSDALNISTGVQTATVAYVAATPTASWQLVRASYLIPADAVGLTFQMNTSASQASGVAWAYSDMQVELGYAVTSFDQRPQGMELMLCQRYYQKSYEQGTVPGTVTRTGVVMLGTYSNTATGPNNGVGLKFPVVMRVAPTSVVYYDPDATNTTATGRYDAAAVPATAGAMSGTAGDSGLHAISIATTGRTAGAGLGILFHYTASAEL